MKTIKETTPEGVSIQVIEAGELQQLATFHGFTPGIVVTMVDPSELTDSERLAFGITGGEA